MAAPIRILTAVPICDGHDSAINTINLEFIRHGIEVVYLGYHRYAEDIVRAAIQEDVRAVGISSYNGGHIEFFAEVVRQLKKRGADDIKVFGGGGGTITHDDQRVMQKRGVDQIFFAGTSLSDMVKWVHQRYRKGHKHGGRKSAPADMQLARNLACEYGKHNIRVNCIAPGLIKTDFARALWENPETLKASTARSPLARIGDPDEIAGAAVFLGSAAGTFTTGQTIVIDGGATIS